MCRSGWCAWVVDRFWRKHNNNAYQGCWLWQSPALWMIHMDYTYEWYIKTTAKISAIHESGHAVFAELYGVPINYITIKKWPMPHFEFCIRAIPALVLHPEKRAITFLSGSVVQKYYNPDSPDDSGFDRRRLFLIPGQDRKKYAIKIRKRLNAPEIRNRIERLSLSLLNKGTLYRKEILAILSECDWFKNDGRNP